MQHTMKIYQAPLQGFTDFDFRMTLAELFGGIDKFFIPYLSFGKGHEIKKSQLREVFPENNESLPVIPQVLFSNQDELFQLVEILVGYGYPEINLNLGCPYPMATNKGRGAAWLEKPEVLNKVLHQLYAKNFPAKFSVKMRAGMNSEQEAKIVFEVLNQFPLEEVIFHSRTADQMYEGKANPLLFAEAFSLVKNPLVYNGDIFTITDFQNFQNMFQDQEAWMIGRGLLSNPALAAQMKGEKFDQKELREKFRDFHDRMFERYSFRLAGGNHILMRMNQFWTYFCESFENPHKAMKLVKKSSTLMKYNAAVAEIFKSF